MGINSLNQLDLELPIAMKLNLSAHFGILADLGRSRRVLFKLRISMFVETHDREDLGLKARLLK
jgi:hypothetical protein